MNSSEEIKRTRAFQILKPVCVGLSQSALRRDNSQILSRLKDLLKITDSNEISSYIDPQLAEYIFFPLQHLLRQLERISVKAQELTLKCIEKLLQTGWKKNINKELAVQLLILFSFILESHSDDEDLKAACLSCLSLTINALGQDHPGKKALTATENVPHIGKLLSVVLDTIKNPPSDHVRVEALQTLQSFCLAWPDLDAMSTNLFPGIISTLTKVLTAKASIKPSSKSLIIAILILHQLFSTVMSDSRTKSLPEKTERDDSPGPSKSWLKASSAQLKLALSSILQLRRHEKSTVRIQIAKLCLDSINQCWESLSESRDMFVETLVVISSTDQEVRSDLESLLTINDNVAGMIETNLYNTMNSLPRIVYSSDELARQRTFSQVSIMLNILSGNGEQLIIVKGILASNLRDSVSNAIKEFATPKIEVQRQVTGQDTINLSMVNYRNRSSFEFENIFESTKGATSLFKEVTSLVQEISSEATLSSIAKYLLLNLRSGPQNDQIANFWLSLMVLEKIRNQSEWMDEFMTVSSDSQFDQLSTQIYTFALDILTQEETNSTDWKLQCLALQAIAFESNIVRKDFRTELMDCLYPVVQSLASPNQIIQQHAITCLNIISQECGYPNTSTLIIQNVDYLVNSVGLKLNTFDLSPQAPQVLIMMVKLTGPSLIPFLDDLVDSIFSALESFHGYPKLVDLLFTALTSIVEEGSRTELLTIKQPGIFNSKQNQITSINPKDLIQDFRQRSGRYDSKIIEVESESDEENDNDNNLNHNNLDNNGNDQKITENSIPRSDIKSHNGLSVAPKLDISETDQSQLEESLSKTHTLLLNITRLTQHYISASSLKLRIRLLSLLQTSLPVLASHENTFLPLIHTLWPVLVARLASDDEEAFVVVGALDVITVMCNCAKSFMASRIDEVWSLLVDMVYRARILSRSDSRNKAPSSSLGQRLRITNYKNILLPRPAYAEYGRDNSNGSRGSSKVGGGEGVAVYSNTNAIWESFVSLMMAVAANVRISDAKFDQMMQMLEPVLLTRKDVSQALASRNPDAVWLALWRLQQRRTNNNNEI